MVIFDYQSYTLPLQQISVYNMYISIVTGPYEMSLNGMFSHLDFFFLAEGCVPLAGEAIVRRQHW